MTAASRTELGGHVTNALLKDLFPAINQWMQENYKQFSTYPASVPDEYVESKKYAEDDPQAAEDP